MMRPQTQELKQEIERQTSKLRERLYPFFKNSEASDIFWTVVILVSLVVTGSYIASYAADFDNLIIVHLLCAVGFLIVLACIWINRLWFTDSTDREQEKNLSARELITRFEEESSHCIKAAASMTVGLVCWGGSVLIGIFNFYAIVPMLFFGNIAAQCLLYWHYLRSEKMARLLVDQISD